MTTTCFDAIEGGSPPSVFPPSSPSRCQRPERGRISRACVVGRTQVSLQRGGTQEHDGERVSGFHPIRAPSILHPLPSALHPPSRACALGAFAYPRPTPDLDGHGQRLQHMGAVMEVLGCRRLLVRAMRGNRRSGRWARMAEEGDVGKDIGSRRSIRRKGWESDSAAQDLAQRRSGDDDEGGDFMPKEQGRGAYASPCAPAVGEHRTDWDTVHQMHPLQRAMGTLRTIRTARTRISLPLLYISPLPPRFPPSAVAPSTTARLPLPLAHDGGRVYSYPRLSRREGVVEYGGWRTEHVRGVAAGNGDSAVEFSSSRRAFRSRIRAKAAVGQRGLKPT
ncbi:hypothetical protein C8R44DRAFT_892534 [Mycena epipterygia]|nr:hypothetical protein C8R44DRAFT_892534 [Mycena epipterygia]